MDINFKTIEKKWQDKWESEKTFVVSENSKKPKYYALEMFPYPSGSGLHMGHAWNYTIGDILARFKIMQGFNVLHPMGYDALGLPAENAAIKEGIHPEEYTKASISNYIKQQKELGLSYDWSRVLSTANPEFYKWDQWIFLKLLEKSLAYQKESSVNWCPKCDTVLANEQVHDGMCWRHEDTPVQTKSLKQWFFKTTNYANELYDEIDNLDWPKRTKSMQKNWIGKSHGTEIIFQINNEPWKIFTTRPDTIFGVTFMVVAAAHPDLDKIVTQDQKSEVEKFLKSHRSISEKDLETTEKAGVFTGSYAINPANNQKIPVYAGNFVVAEYGSGMVMAVPAHDKRDFDFAKKYGIEIKQVINSGEPLKSLDEAFTGKGSLINSEEFSGLESSGAKEKITSWLKEKNVASKVTNFKLRDWGVSRQRYWGTPIPIIHCDSCGAVPVPESDLPVVLPKKVTFGKGNPLESAADWIKASCPKCNSDAKRETDTMDTFVNSSWYFLRYTDPSNDKEIFDPKKAEYWSPIDTYIGGAEHACMHLIYFRFYTKFLRDLGLITFGEPAKKLFHQGMLNAKGGEKMSKSKGNIVLPETISDKYGIDTARFFMSSLASPDKDIDWDEHGINGSSKFIQKIFRYYSDKKNEKTPSNVKAKINKGVQEVTTYYDSFEYRKATIILRELFSAIESQPTSKETKEIFLQLLSPICPHITEELWNSLGNKDFISTSSWPKAEQIKDEKNARENLTTKIIQTIHSLIEKSPAKKVTIYLMPHELKLINSEEIKNQTSLEVKIFAVNDQKKYDPEKKASKAKPGKPSIFLE